MFDDNIGLFMQKKIILITRLILQLFYAYENSYIYK